MKFKFILSALLLCFTMFTGRATVIYVDSSHVGGTQNGLTWATAFSGFQAGINAAATGDSLWVAKGTYIPPLASSFNMAEGVKIFGGFLNTHTQFNQRNWQIYLTILKSSNVRVIVNNGNNLTNAALIDGIKIIGNGSNNGSISGGIYNNQSSPSIVNCTFIQNLSSAGGAILNIQSSPVISNCIFSNNAANSSSSSDNSGGAIYNDQSNPIITNCTFSGNTTTGEGGGIYNIGTSAPVISYCTFLTNTAPSGGAIYNEGTANNILISHCNFGSNSGSQLGGGGVYNSGSTTLNIFGCTFSNSTNSALINSATCIIDSSSFIANINIFGGGIQNSGTLQVANSTFTSNSANGYEGGAINSSSGTLALNRCLFIENIAGLGGALRCHYTNANIKNCSFLGNKTGDPYYGGGYGAGIYASNSTLALVNCLISGNLCSQGAAIYNYETTVKMINCTVAGNRAPYDTYVNMPGNCIYNSSSNCKITNSIIWNNQAGMITNPFSTANVTYSLVQGITPTPGSHNITGDPQFTDAPYYLTAPFINGNYRLQSSSVCRNKGYNDSIPAGLLTDIEGNPRITGDTVDMGAYEFLLVPPSVNLGNDTAICAGTSLNLNAMSSGSSYLWNTGDTTQMITVAGAGTYIVTATNPLGYSSDTIVVAINPLPVVNLGNDTTLCAGAILNAQNPGSTYFWSNLYFTQTITVNYSGTYMVTVTDTNLCKGKDTIQLIVNPLPIVSLGSDIYICAGQTTTLNAQNAGASYLWNNAATSQTITVTNSGIYSVAVKNAYQCIGKDTIQVTVNTLPVVDLGEDTAFCSGNTIVLNALNPGATYLWNNMAATQSINVTNSGTYAVKVTSANLCVSSDTINITVNPSPIVYLGLDTTICNGTTLLLNANNPGSSYLWNTGATTQAISVSNSGTYAVNVVAGNLCKVIDTIQVTVAPLPVVTLGNDTGICSGQVLLLDAQHPGATYLWNNAVTTQTIATGASGTYSVTVTDVNYCKGGDTIQVMVNALPVVVLGNDTSFCAGNQLTLNAQNTGAVYLWNNAATSQMITVSTNGTYAVTVTDGNLCKGSDTIQVTVNALPMVDLGNDTALCTGNNILLDAQNIGSIYNWSDGSTTQSLAVTTAGIYHVTVTGGNNCSNSDTIEVSNNPLPVVNLGNDTAFCAGNAIILDAQHTGYTYAWSNAATTQTIAVSVSGNYYVVVTDTNQCEGVDSITIIINALPVVNLGNDTTVVNGTALTLHAGNPGSSYLWNDGTTGEAIAVTVGGTYSVVVTNANGCTASDTILVTMDAVGIGTVKTEGYILTVTPNPATEIVYINFSDPRLLHTKAKLIDAYGRVVRTIIMESKSQAFLLTALAQGVYTLLMQNGQTIKIVKSN